MATVSAAERTPKTAAVIRQALALFFAGMIELRAPRDGRAGTISGYYDNMEALAGDVAKLDARGDLPGIYVTANPVNRALLARAANRCIEHAKHATSDADIISRRWLLIDFDPVRPAGISSTDIEHEGALSKAREAREWLAEQGIPRNSVMLADSGNGAHLLVRIDLPNDAEATALVKHCLAALDLRFSNDAVKVDQTTSNAARIWKVYNTMARKGDSTADRPHRRARLLDVPDRIEVAAREILERLATLAPTAPEPDRAAPRNSGRALDVGAWLLEHGIAVAFDAAWNGGHKWILRACPFAADDHGTDRAAFVVQFPSGAIAAGCHHNRCQGWGWRDLRAKYEPSATQRGGHAPASDATDPADDKPVIQLVESRWNDTIRAAADVIRDVIYMRDAAPMLLRSIDRSDGRGIEGTGDVVDIDGVHHAVGSLALVDATPGRVRYQLDEHVQFERWVRRSQEWVPTRCHGDIASQMVGNAAELSFRPCAGIVRVPLFVGGQLVTQSGWHRASGLILDVSPLPELPAHPTRQDAERALERLLRPFRGFKGSVDRCALSAAVLTAVLRPSLRTAPAILLDGNAPGVGKGLIAQTVSMLATGGRPATITEGHNAEETEKRIAAALLSGVPVVLLDNLQRHVASSALESALTEGVATIRVFGALTNLHVPCRALIVLTANNATLRRDMLRRTLPLRIVVLSEAPEQRQFDFDPVTEAGRDRNELLAAAYTVALGWSQVRHLPEHAAHHRMLGSFPEWSDLVAGAVSWLTGQHPIDLIAQRKTEDHYLSAERAIIEALAAHYGDAEWRAADAAQAIPVELWADVMPRLEQGASPTPRDVGNWLRSRKDRVFSTWILTGVPDRKRVGAWRLTRTAGYAGSAGCDLPPTSDLAAARPDAQYRHSFETGQSTPGDTRQTRHPTDGGDGVDGPSPLFSGDEERF